MMAKYEDLELIASKLDDIKEQLMDMDIEDDELLSAIEFVTTNLDLSVDRLSKVLPKDD